MEQHAVSIDFSALHQEIAAELHTTELRAAELRGQLAMIARIVQEAQRPSITHGADAPDPATNGRTIQSGPLG